MSIGFAQMATAVQEDTRRRLLERLAQQLAERRQAEIERSNQAREAQAQAQLQQTGELRRAQETGTEEYRRGQQQTALTLQQMRDAINQTKIDAANQRATDVATTAAQHLQDLVEGAAADRAERARHNRATEANSAAAVNTAKLTKVEDQDPDTGQTRIRYLPLSELAGQTFQKGPGQTVANRLASARVVAQTGDKMIAKLSDPTYADKLGPVLGRYSTIQDFLGNPPPEFSELAGNIESYALANMGVHGMRSAQGAEQIKKLLAQKHTPASLAATITGLSAFSKQFIENEGRGSPTTPRQRTDQELQDILKARRSRGQ